MASNSIHSSPSYSFSLDNTNELHLKRYIETRKNQEILGGLIGDIKGKTKKGLEFAIKSFLPFPNMAQDKRNFGDLSSLWFEILEEWRLYNYPKLKFIGFLHSHPNNSSRLSVQDNSFAVSLRERYGTMLFIIIGENVTLRCYLFKNETPIIITGNCSYYKCLLR